MGTFFSRTPLAEPNEELLNMLKQKKLKEIDEVKILFNYFFFSALKYITIIMFSSKH